MDGIMVNKNDELTIKLLHYFITEQGYNPIVLHGVQNEIWLENMQEDYKIVRIVSGYIHNNEQLKNDIFKTKQIVRKIKRRTLSMNINTLSLFLDLGDNVNLNKYSDVNNIEMVLITKESDLSSYKCIVDYFPDIEKQMTFTEKGFELFVKLTSEINKKNEGDAKMAEDIFTPKKPIITEILIGINIFVYILTLIYINPGDLAVYRPSILNGEYYRLLTGAFVHGGVFHLLFNCYALYIIGSQLESFLGKTKFLIIYLFSALTGSLTSILFNVGPSVGASGAIFGLLGSLLYFGYHYRVYLGTVIRSQIIPLIIINLLIGMLPGIDNWAHIGGLIGGALITIALGIKYKSSKFEITNGVLISIMFILFLLYMVFVRGF